MRHESKNISLFWCTELKGGSHVPSVSVPRFTKEHQGVILIKPDPATMCCTSAPPGRPVGTEQSFAEGLTDFHFNEFRCFAFQRD